MQNKFKKGEDIIKYKGQGNDVFDIIMFEFISDWISLQRLIILLKTIQGAQKSRVVEARITRAIRAIDNELIKFQHSIAQKIKDRKFKLMGINRNLII